MLNKISQLSSWCDNGKVCFFFNFKIYSIYLWMNEIWMNEYVETSEIFIKIILSGGRLFFLFLYTFDRIYRYSFGIKMLSRRRTYKKDIYFIHLYRRANTLAESESVMIYIMQ